MYVKLEKRKKFSHLEGLKWSTIFVNSLKLYVVFIFAFERIKVVQIIVNICMFAQQQ